MKRDESQREAGEKRSHLSLSSGYLQEEEREVSRCDKYINRSFFSNASS